MANRPSIPAGIRLDLQQLQLEAQHRWLRPAEVCEILRNHPKFQISSEPSNKPPSGSLFLFDRKILRYFRKDGHNWRKKKDGKTVKEAHEKLKVGSVDVLHCYYAHGEENECFQRRCYWLLEEEFMHIVFVHYLEIKGNRNTIRETDSVISNSHLSNSPSSSVSNSYSEVYAGTMGSPSAASTLTSAYEDIESEDNYQAISKFPSPHNLPHPDDSYENIKIGGLINSKLLPTYSGGELSDPGLGYISLPQTASKTNDDPQFRTLDLASWEEVFEQCTRGSGNVPSQPSMGSNHLVGTETSEYYNENWSQILDLGFGVNYGLECSLVSKNLQRKNPIEPSNAEPQDNSNSSLGTFQSLLGGIKTGESLQKVDSFSKWMTKELDGVEDLHSKSSSSLLWQNIETAAAVDDPSAQLDNYAMSPSIGQDQLFDIHDFSPSRAYTHAETKVLITGKFMMNSSEVPKYKWSCMFGEVEVPAEVVGNDTLCCFTPVHSAGRIPFYITCSNRFACSQVREFEYLEECHVNIGENSVTDRQLLLQLEKLLSSRLHDKTDLVPDNISKQETVNKILVSMEDELSWGVEHPLKEKVVTWLVDKVNDDGKGPNLLDEKGQGLLHLAAAIGFDWIIPPTLAAGVSVNFRDVNGWTALHWAACYGREKTVALLIALGAAPGLVTDPSPKFPLGRTPAELASANGFKGISGYLAESFLTSHLASLTMTDPKLDSSSEASITKAVQTVEERVANPGDGTDGSDPSLKDSLAAVRNATQAAGRIHQVFRMQSFQRKQMSDSVGDDESLLTDERLLSLISSRIPKPGCCDEQSLSAAIHIQKKFRGWKKRKEFLIIRERVVKIQAHVRGHQVRKRYKPVIWSVGILEKVILRWRRKGTGLRGFRSEAVKKVSSMQEKSSEDDDYDYLKEGRKQSEQRFQKALVRVKSMVQYPEGRAQYRRLLTEVEGFQKNKQNSCSDIVENSESVPLETEDDMLDVASLLDEDKFMAFAFEQ